MLPKSKDLNFLWNCKPLLRKVTVVLPEPEKYLRGACTARWPSKSIACNEQTWKWIAWSSSKWSIMRLPGWQEIARAWIRPSKMWPTFGKGFPMKIKRVACSFRAPSRENLVSVIRNFISCIRFTKLASHFLEAWHLRTDRESLCSLLVWGCPRGITHGEVWGPDPADSQHAKVQWVIWEEARAEPQRLWKDKEASVLLWWVPRNLL